MKMERAHYEMEIVREIWDNKEGTCFKSFDVGPDRDGLKLIEIKERSSDGKIISRLSMTNFQAVLVAQALNECAKELEEIENGIYEKTIEKTIKDNYCS